MFLLQTSLIINRVPKITKTLSSPAWSTSRWSGVFRSFILPDPYPASYKWGSVPRWGGPFGAKASRDSHDNFPSPKSFFPCRKHPLHTHDTQPNNCSISPQLAAVFPASADSAITFHYTYIPNCLIPASGRPGPPLPSRWHPGYRAGVCPMPSSPISHPPNPPPRPPFSPHALHHNTSLASSLRRPLHRLGFVGKCSNGSLPREPR